MKTAIFLVLSLSVMINPVFAQNKETVRLRNGAKPMILGIIGGDKLHCGHPVPANGTLTCSVPAGSRVTLRAVGWVMPGSTVTFRCDGSSHGGGQYKVELLSSRECRIVRD